jgi:heat shock transcription factor
MSNQLTRRSTNQQLISRGARPYNATSNTDPWADMGDDNVDVQGFDPAIDENDNIEALEQKALITKREAQSKRKQIPPFVQKLSRFG